MFYITSGQRVEEKQQLLGRDERDSSPPAEAAVAHVGKRGFLRTAFSCARRGQSCRQIWSCIVEPGP